MWDATCLGMRSQAGCMRYALDACKAVMTQKTEINWYETSQDVLLWFKHCQKLQQPFHIWMFSTHLLGFFLCMLTWASAWQFWYLQFEDRQMWRHQKSEFYSLVPPWFPVKCKKRELKCSAYIGNCQSRKWLSWSLERQTQETHSRRIIEFLSYCWHMWKPSKVRITTVLNIVASMG